MRASCAGFFLGGGGSSRGSQGGQYCFACLLCSMMDTDQGARGRRKGPPFLVRDSQALAWGGLRQPPPFSLPHAFGSDGANRLLSGVACTSSGAPWTRHRGQKKVACTRHLAPNMGAAGSSLKERQPQKSVLLFLPHSQSTH